FFALTFTGAYSLVYNLAEGMRRSLHDGSRERHTSRGTIPGQVLDSTALSSDVSSKGQEPVTPVQRAIRSPVTAGLLVGTFISIIGNLDGIVQLGQWAWTKIASPGQAGLAFDFWRSSRMIPPLENLDPSPVAFWAPDKVPGAPDISYHITEFPFFTFLFADLHAHMMVIPFTLLVIGLGLSIVVGLKNAGWLWGLTVSIALGLALGSLWVINSWDYPPYLVLAVTLLGLAVLLRQGSFPGKIGLLAVLGAGVVAVSVLAFLPFHQVYETFDAGIAASKWRTPLDRYLGIHGLFLFLAATFLIHQTRHDLLELFRGFLPKSRCVRELGEISSRRSWLITYLGLGLLAVVYLAVAGYWTAALLLVPLVLTGLALWNALASEETARPNSLVPLVLLAMALAIGIGVDFVRLNGDIGRMNTLFKLYLEGWVLFSLVSSYMLWRLASRGWFRWPWGWARGTWVGVLALLLVSSLIYPVLGTRARVADRFSDGPVSLDGVAYMNNAIHMEEEQLLKLKWDLQAIEWLQDKVEGSPVVLEAHHEQYYWSARIASYTGLPTVIGWPWHQIQQRTAYSYAIRDRAEDVRQIYNTTDVRFAKELLDKYEVEYIVVGELERAYYSEKGLGKFEEMFERGWVKPVFESQKVRIFRVM
ncbi:MAG TPA: DUF2298 domain-containing protein, partial [Dehalococcoidia bacterium]|nr:DUF2298 domain-containing protein [Dehalococcoidia bacterium]